MKGKQKIELALKNWNQEEISFFSSFYWYQNYHEKASVSWEIAIFPRVLKMADFEQRETLCKILKIGGFDGWSSEG